ncbi:hypothetical protein SUGI_0937220 [Cryptomeria japonica]|nr:hypothetical protein SUGI_0937220 [Cryptomeria japonica]
MDCFGSQEEKIRGNQLGLSSDHNLKTGIIHENEMLALMECHVENFDAFDEEEDLKGLVGKEELINKVMKSLEMEIASPKFLHLEEAAEAVNSCCLQSDSAISMDTCSSSFSDPCQLNLITECRCHGEAQDGDPQLGFILSNEMFHELFETSEFYGSEIEGMDILQSLSRTESFSSMKELMDLDMVGVWE